MHNGWSWTDLEPADRTKIFEDLLKDCYEMEGITTQQDPPLKKEHATNPLLSKYYYIHRPEQATTKEAELQTSEVRVDTGDIQVSKMNLALGDKGPDIKIEPFGWVPELIQSGGQCQDQGGQRIWGYHRSLQGSQGYAPEPWQGHDLRNDLAASKLEISSDMDQAKAKALCQKLTDWKEKGSQHLDGLKALKRRIQALLEG